MDLLKTYKIDFPATTHSDCVCASNLNKKLTCVAGNLVKRNSAEAC